MKISAFEKKVLIFFVDSEKVCNFASSFRWSADIVIWEFQYLMRAERWVKQVFFSAGVAI